MTISASLGRDIEHNSTKLVRSHPLRPAQGWNNRTLAAHEQVDSRFLLLPSSEFTSTEITEYLYFSPLNLL